jgi:hypothetical protein
MKKVYIPCIFFSFLDKAKIKISFSKLKVKNIIKPNQKKYSYHTIKHTIFPDTKYTRLLTQYSITEKKQAKLNMYNNNRLFIEELNDS